MEPTKIAFTDIVLEEWCYPVLDWNDFAPRHDDIKDIVFRKAVERQDKREFDISIMMARTKFILWVEK